MQWPCPSGFHVPTRSEMTAIKTAMTNLWISTSNGDTAKTYLKMPYAWFRDYTSWSTTGSGWSYWTCEGSSSQYSRYLLISSSMFSVNTWYNGSWYSIRPFKDDAVVPDSWWTTLYTWTWTAWIFHNSTLWLISISSDWTTRITISDKNLWATTVYNSWDTLSQSNCWNFYQRWNNYWFPFTWTVTTSSTKVDTTWYWPWNYYSSSTFVTANTSSWISWTNYDLRWWVTGITKDQNVSEIYIWDWNNYSAMQWPCPSWYHVPSSDERTSVINVRTSLCWLITDTTNFCIALKLPLSGRRRNNATAEKQGEQWRYRCNEITSGSVHSSNILYLPTDGISTSWNYRSWGEPVRAFKDVQVVPTSGWTKLYWTSIEAGWIFWSSTDWLISLSSDWTTWITIADKNVWATTVWNNGDTLSVSNCGNYFQRWNNYWFPFTWTIGSTSWSLVNANSYWPWDYYSSSTFITRSGSPYRWDSGNNANLWGATTWITKVPNVKEVYVWSTKIRPVIRAEFTDWDSDVVDYVTQVFLDAGDELKGAIEIMFGWDFAQSIETATWTDLSDWEFSPIMPFYPIITTSWYGLQISNWWDMIDKHLVSEVPSYTQSICIIRDNDNLGDAEYIVWTYDSSDDWFDYQLSSLATHFSGKDTVCMFIFLM